MLTLLQKIVLIVFTIFIITTIIIITWNNLTDVTNARIIEQREWLAKYKQTLKLHPTSSTDSSTDGFGDSPSDYQPDITP